MQLTITTCALVVLYLSSVSANAIAMRKTKFHHKSDYCGEISNPFAGGKSECVCVNQLNEALVHTRFEGLEPLFAKYVREGPACTPPASTDSTASPTSTTDFDFNTDSSTSIDDSFATETATSTTDFDFTTDSSTSSDDPFATETATNDGGDQDFDETFDSPQTGDEKYDDGEFVGLDFDLGSL